MNDDAFLPDIFQHLETVHNQKSVTGKGLDEYVVRVSAKTGLPTKISKEIVIGFFEEVRNAMARGDVVNIRGLGKFLLAKPSNSKNKKKIFAKFKPYKNLIERMNNER